MSYKDLPEGVWDEIFQCIFQGTADGKIKDVVNTWKVVLPLLVKIGVCWKVDQKPQFSDVAISD